MSLTGSHIATALKAAGSATTGKVASLDAIADLFNQAMIKYGGGEFTTVNRVAALISECMMESAYFMTTVEYANTGAYQPYRGRTFIQLTWSTNYDKFGEWCHQQGLLSDPNQFINNPVDLGHLEWAALGGVWYFTRVKFHGKALVEYANNIDQVGKAVNLGDPLSGSTPNGMAARRAAYNAVVKLGKVIIPTGSSTGGSDAGTTTVTTPVPPTLGSIQTPYGQKGTSWQKGYHPGDDWHRNAGAAEIGDPIVAVAAGKIIYAGDARKTDAGWGKAFGIHVLNTWTAHGRTSIDAHMSKLAAGIKAGVTVKAGQVIGYKGATGNVTGPHDHHEQHTGPKWTDPDVKPIYPGTTSTAPKEGVPIMTKPTKFHLQKDITLAKSKYYHSVPLNDAGTTYSIATGPGTVFVTANVTAKQNCWARFVTVDYKKGETTKIITPYPRVHMNAGGDELVLWDTIGGPSTAGWSRRVRLQVLAYSAPVVVTDVLLRAGKEK